MKKICIILLALFIGGKLLAHPMPSSVVALSIMDKVIKGEAKIPKLELANAVGDARVANLDDPFFRYYFEQHIKCVSTSTSWTTSIESVAIITDKDPVVGSYQEVVVRFTLTPKDKQYLRSFTFDYDAVIHQVVTHSALVYVTQDWNNGLQQDGNAQQVGIIKMDVPTGKIYPLLINLQEGSWSKGFQSMVGLGMQHIREGADHLLFLVVLLLPAMLLYQGKRWGRFGGTRYSIRHLFTIVTAFTIGHSVTLLLGSSGLVRFPGRPVEILIAVSILISAVHAFRPMFPGKEQYIAAGFGLIHGLAFASVLANLQLPAGKMALSILGFNLGIELMQLFIIALIAPWLILLSNTTFYRWVRPLGAALASLAAIAWIIQRATGTDNIVTELIDIADQYGIYLVALLALFAAIAYVWQMYSDIELEVVNQEG